ncbi:MAG: DNA-directed RNA polymerase subunit omega [Candidatus Cellulosilyticum pullistercoris]|uniref:DNA-directed RNA polymerase subunit omega n=1 Tax=Candidatus Cellulosilyticum pullistercoris TaxID=2838521 RepID=A0A9E2KD41_9FIRM|nr:DNA-directed RNA polymerase subunit omega [Candidatus Cellulosilyticum pullistercoris]
MLQPSYTQIMQKLNAEGESKLTSRYSIVIAAAKRARNIIDVINEQAAATKEADKSGERTISPERMKEANELNELLKSKKPISIAVDEIYEGKMRMKEYHAPLEEDEVTEE